MIHNTNNGGDGVAARSVAFRKEKAAGGKMKHVSKVQKSLGRHTTSRRQWGASGVALQGQRADQSAAGSLLMSVSALGTCLGPQQRLVLELCSGKTQGVFMFLYL